MNSPRYFEDGEARFLGREQSDEEPAFLDELGALTVPRLLAREAGSSESAGSASLQWFGPETTLTVAGHAIEDPRVYYSNGIPAIPEASCVNGELEVGVPGFEDCPPLGHWPCYALLTPRQRANYLTWLAGGKEEPLKDAGYVFLYFYGLERHALIDGGDPEAAIREMLRLLDAYGHSKSFFGCASRFVVYLFAFEGIARLREEWFKRLFLNPHVQLHRDVLAVALTWLYERDATLPGALAFEVARQDIRSSRSAAVAQRGDDFRALFLERYDLSFPTGMNLEAGPEPRTWWYRPASPSFQDWEVLSKLRPVIAPDVLGVVSQFTPLTTIWNECAADLSPGLPADLDHPDLARWDALVERRMDEKGRVFVPVSDLGALCDVDSGEDALLTLQQSLKLAEAARAAGFDLLPDPRVLLRPYRMDDVVALARPIGVAIPNTEKYFLAGALLLELGMAMAVVDGRLERVEVLHVSEIVHALFHFSENDRQRLRLLRHLFVSHPPNLIRLCRRLRTVLTDAEMEGVAAFLVSVAASNYTIEPSERRGLRKSYRTLGVHVGKLDAILDELERSNGAADGAPAPLKIDEGALTRMMAGAAFVAVAVGNVLAEMVAEESDDPPRDAGCFRRATAVDASPCTTPTEDSEQRYRAELYALLSRSDWGDEEFVALAQRHGLFPAGLERDWAEADDEGAIESGIAAHRFCLTSEPRSPSTDPGDGEASTPGSSEPKRSRPSARGRRPFEFPPSL
jgi:TerB N-terminal domain/Tellurite resistance protein TerB